MHPGRRLGGEHYRRVGEPGGVWAYYALRPAALCALADILQPPAAVPA